MTITKRYPELIEAIEQSKQNCNQQLETLRDEALNLGKAIEKISFINIHDDLIDMINIEKESLQRLEQEAFNQELDMFKVLENRQDILFCILEAKETAPTKVIERDINLGDPIRLKAWLSVNQSSIPGYKVFDTRPIKEALAKGVFPDEVRQIQDNINKLEKLRKTVSSQSSMLETNKSKLLETGLKFITH